MTRCGWTETGDGHVLRCRFDEGHEGPCDKIGYEPKSESEAEAIKPLPALDWRRNETFLVDTSAKPTRVMVDGVWFVPESKDVPMCDVCGNEGEIFEPVCCRHCLQHADDLTREREEIIKAIREALSMSGSGASQIVARVEANESWAAEAYHLLETIEYLRGVGCPDCGGERLAGGHAKGCTLHKLMIERMLILRYGEVPK